MKEREQKTGTDLTFKQAARTFGNNNNPPFFLLVLLVICMYNVGNNNISFDLGFKDGPQCTSYS